MIGAGDASETPPALVIPRALLAQAPVSGQGASVPPAPGAAPSTTDDGPPRGEQWMAGAGHAWSIGVFQSRGGRRYVPLTVSWGRELTRDGGPGLLRGRLLWGVEVMPILAQYAPTATVGVSVSPLLWRWQFTPRRRVAAFAELAFGGLLTRDPVPEGTTRTNFLTHGAFGLRWRPGARLSPVAAYRFQHVSNGNAQATNPGVNAHVLWVGVAMGRR